MWLTIVTNSVLTVLPLSWTFREAMPWIERERERGERGRRGTQINTIQNHREPSFLNNFGFLFLGHAFRQKPSTAKIIEKPKPVFCSIRAWEQLLQTTKDETLCGKKNNRTKLWKRERDSCLLYLFSMPAGEGVKRGWRGRGACSVSQHTMATEVLRVSSLYILPGDNTLHNSCWRVALHWTNWAVATNFDSWRYLLEILEN